MIKDTIAPVLTIPPNKTLEFGNNFDPPSPEDAGTATAVDDCCEVTVENGGITYEDTEEDLSDNTDKRIMAIIKRKWKAKDESGNFSIDIDDNHIQTITLEDTKPAVLTLVGPSHVRIKEGMPYEDPGVEAVDYPEGSLSQVTVHTFGLPSSNPPRAGRHVIVYTAVDGGGNVSDAVRRWVTVTACFTGDAILSTDQGLVEIKAVDTTYTINGEAIKGISEATNPVPRPIYNSISFRAFFKVILIFFKARAPIPWRCPITPNNNCSVPTKLWPIRRASSCDNMMTLIAPSVNFSNIIIT